MINWLSIFNFKKCVNCDHYHRIFNLEYGKIPFQYDGLCSSNRCYVMENTKACDRYCKHSYSH